MTNTQPIAPLDSAQTAIVAVDFQHDVIGAEGAFAAMFHAEVERVGVIPATVRLLRAARTTGAKIVYSRATFSRVTRNWWPTSQSWPTAEYGCLVDGTPGAAVIDAVKPHDSDLAATWATEPWSSPTPAPPPRPERRTKHPSNRWRCLPRSCRSISSAPRSPPSQRS
jgi:hypothetical protein